MIEGSNCSKSLTQKGTDPISSRKRSDEERKNNLISKRGSSYVIKYCKKEIVNVGGFCATFEFTTQG